jgi:hypothetical protein
MRGGLRISICAHAMPSNHGRTHLVAAVARPPADLVARTCLFPSVGSLSKVSTRSLHQFGSHTLNLF